MATTTNYTEQAYVLESVQGETPLTPQFQKLPTTGGTIASNVTTQMSEVIRDDRQTDDLEIVDLNVAGDLNYELVYAPYKPIMLALLQNDTVTSISATNAEVDGIDFNIVSSAGIEALVNIGDTFKLSSLLDSEIDGEYICIDNTTPDQITIYPPMSSDMTAQTDISIDATSISTNGSDVPNSYTFKTTATNAGVEYYWYNRGMNVNSMTFNFATGSLLNGAMNLVGLTEEATDTKISGELDDLPTQSYSIMNNTSSIGIIYVDGITLGTCFFESLNITYDNQISQAKSVGTLGACATASFSLNITGSVEVFFKDLSLYHKFLNAESFSMNLVLKDRDGNVIGFHMPKIKFETLNTPIPGKDQFLKQSGTIRALRDSDLNYMMKLSFVDG